MCEYCYCCCLLIISWPSQLLPIAIDDVSCMRARWVGDEGSGCSGRGWRIRYLLRLVVLVLVLVLAATSPVEP